MAALFRTERSIPYASIETAGRKAAESLLVITVGVLLGRLAWVILAASDGAQSSADHAVRIADGSAQQQSSKMLLTQMNPFSAAQVDLSGTDTPRIETTLDLKLSGVRSVAGNTAASSAVISFPDGGQKRFVPGDEVMPGVVLVNVAPDAVHLSRDGSLETLSLTPGRTLPFTPRTAPDSGSGALLVASASSDAALDQVTPAALASDTVLKPEFRSGRVSGYKVEPRGAGAFEAVGLQSGDLILRINGEAIEGLRPEQISHTVSSSQDVALDVVRQGAIVKLRVSPGAGFSQ